MRVFVAMRKKLILDAQIKIAYTWRWYCKEKAKRIIADKLNAESIKKANRDAKTDRGQKILVQTIKTKDTSAGIKAGGATATTPGVSPVKPP